MVSNEAPHGAPRGARARRIFSGRVWPPAGPTSAQIAAGERSSLGVKYRPERPRGNPMGGRFPCWLPRLCLFHVFLYVFRCFCFVFTCMCFFDILFSVFVFLFVLFVCFPVVIVFLQKLHLLFVVVVVVACLLSLFVIFCLFFACVFYIDFLVYMCFVFCFCAYVGDRRLRLPGTPRILPCSIESVGVSHGGGSQGEKILRASMFVVFARRAAGTGFRGGQLPLASGKAWPPTETVGKHVAPCIGPASMAPSSGRGYATEFGSSRGHDHRIRPRAPQGFAGHRGVRMQRATTKTERTTDP